ncbi:MAG: alkyl sulfatase dimerization domain-containing protein [Pseudomonadota bacterium]
MATSESPKPATAATRAQQQRVAASLPFADRGSFANAERGFIASLEPLRLTNEQGRVVYDLEALKFLDGEAPATVNPSLWRQAQLNAQHHGLFEVVDGIYQIRSFDIANMTLVRGDRGWIVIDPLTCAEASKAGLDLANEQLGERPVTGVIITHSHVDHYAGILGVISAADAATHRVPVLAPPNFVEEALSENVMVGNAMNRRATFMYGNRLRPGPDGFVSAGLGAALAMGSTGFVVPNDTIEATGCTRSIDGVEIEFQLTMGTEAPSEMVFYFPAFKALCMSEITSHHLHNLYTLRGAQVRDALAWSAQIQESIDLFGDRLEVQFASHHWPTWGREAATTYLTRQRDLYKYIHDQALRLANQGYTKDELAERLTLPPALAQDFSCRDYYGTLHHNARAVYMRYLGYFDGNPSTLHRHPPSAAAERYLRAMGGADAVLANARTAFAEGDYRWVAELLNHVVLAEPEHAAARSLLADTLEQLGYQAESGPWRNFYLTGALELREPTPKGSPFVPSAAVLRGMPMDHYFKSMAVRVNPERAASLALSLNLEFEDTGERWQLTLSNAVLHSWRDRTDPGAPRVSGNSFAFKRLLLGLDTLDSIVADGRLRIEGNPTQLNTVPDLFDGFDRRFPIVTPRA